MSGIFLVTVLAILGAAAIHIARRITGPIRNAWVRKAATLLLSVAFMTSLVVDELIGGFQFRELCRENAVLRIDAVKARGRTVKVVIEPSNEILGGKAITIYHSHMRFLDVRTTELIAEYHSYVARGGWFIRLLGISEGNAPITIGLPGCSPTNSGTFPKQYGLTLIN